MRIGKIVALGALVAGVSIVVAPKAQAAYILTLQQVGANVVATGSGSIDLTDLSLAGANGNIFAAIMFPSIGVIITGPAANESVDSYAGFAGPASFGGTIVTNGNSGSGDIVGINNAGHQLFLPAGYISGHALSDSATYDNATLASLGATPGTYEWTWGTGPDADSFTLQIGPAPTNTPEPASLALLGTGLAALGLNRRRRRKGA